VNEGEVARYGDVFQWVSPRVDSPPAMFLCARSDDHSWYGVNLNANGMTTVTHLIPLITSGEHGHWERVL
jgi:hypothetical protein